MKSGIIRGSGSTRHLRGSGLYNYSVQTANHVEMFIFPLTAKTKIKPTTVYKINVMLKLLYSNVLVLLVTH